MTLIIWTAADSDSIKKTFGKALQNFRPNIPHHVIVPYKSGELCEGNEGDVILACGAKCLDQLKDAGLAPKGRTLGGLRQKPIPHTSGASYMVTHDPQTVNSEPANAEILDWDLRLAVRYMQKKTLMPEVGHYRWVNSFQSVIDYINEEYERTGKPVKVSTDLETEGFYPWYPDKGIVSISFTAETGTADVLYTGKQQPPIPYDHDVDLGEQIEWILNTPKVSLRLANGKFDMNWIAEKWDIACTNFKFDTMLVGSLLDENRSNSLNLHAKVLTEIGGYDDPFNAKYDKDRMGEIEVADPEVGKDYLIYSGGDTDACQRSADVLTPQLLQHPKLAKFYVRVVHPAARAFENIERRGILIDQQKFHVLRDDLRKAVKESENICLNLMPNKFRIKHMEKMQDQLVEGKSPLTPAILKDFFFGQSGLGLKPLMLTGKSEQPSTAKAHLQMFKDHPAAGPFVQAMSEMNSAQKTLGTFVEGFLKHLRPDGRFHPSYMLFHGAFNDEVSEESGTVTGRLSAKDPAFQTVPSKTKWAKRIRECYVAPKGKKILGLDFAQGELKIVACITPEPTMIEAYQKGLDLHAVTGAQLAEVPLEEFLAWKNEPEESELYHLFSWNRAKAKPANFGLLYGMGAEGFQAYAWASYGLKLTLEEATVMRDAFFNLYPKLLDYHANMRQFAKLHEYVEGPLGRIRHLPHIRSWDRAIRAKAERQAINTPVQCTLTDMMIWAIAEIEAAGIEIEMFGMIHDAVYGYVDEDDAKVQEVATQCAHIMSNLPLHEFGWSPILKFSADAEAGYDLANKQKVKLAA